MISWSYGMSTPVGLFFAEVNLTIIVSNYKQDKNGSS